MGDDCPLDQLELELLLGIVTGLRDISLRVGLIISCFKVSPGLTGDCGRLPGIGVLAGVSSLRPLPLAVFLARTIYSK